jgi:hypothetical protein
MVDITSYNDIRKILSELKDDTLILENTDTNIDDIKNNLSKSLDEYIDNNIKKMISELENIDILNNMPIGTIMMWNDLSLPESKDINNTSKWIWCDGSNGSPDLRLKIPVGNNYDIQGNVNIFDTTSFDGKIKEQNLLEHKHTITINPANKHGHDLGKAHTTLYSEGYVKNPLPKFPIISIFISRGVTMLTEYIKETEHTHSITNEGSITNYNSKHDHRMNPSIKNDGKADPDIFYPRFAYVNFIYKSIA